MNLQILSRLQDSEATKWSNIKLIHFKAMMRLTWSKSKFWVYAAISFQIHVHASVHVIVPSMSMSMSVSVSLSMERNKYREQCRMIKSWSEDHFVGTSPNTECTRYPYKNLAKTVPEQWKSIHVGHSVKVYKQKYVYDVQFREEKIWMFYCWISLCRD